MQHDLIKAACALEGCKLADLLSSRVHEDGQTVTLIIGPVGWKKTVVVDAEAVARHPLDEMTIHVPVVHAEIDAGGFLDIAEESEPPPIEGPTFVEALPLKIRVILEREDLLDPVVLNAMKNSDLERVDGIGRASVRLIREALEACG